MKEILALLLVSLGFMVWYAFTSYFILRLVEELFGRHTLSDRIKKKVREAIKRGRKNT